MEYIISAVTIGKLIEAHKNGNEEMFNIYANFIADVYAEAGADLKAKIIRKRLNGDTNSSVVSLDHTTVLESSDETRAMLVLDEMPICCTKCPFHEMSGNFNQTLCVPKQKSSDKFADKRPDWCPLCEYHEDCNKAKLNPGDTVYVIFDHAVYEAEAIKVVVVNYQDHSFIRVECVFEIEDIFYGDGRMMKHGANEILGEYIFLTREEAEKKLKSDKNYKKG